MEIISISQSVLDKVKSIANRQLNIVQKNINHYCLVFSEPGDTGIAGTVLINRDGSRLVNLVPGTDSVVNIGFIDIPDDITPYVKKIVESDSKTIGGIDVQRDAILDEEFESVLDKIEELEPCSILKDINNRYFIRGDYDDHIVNYLTSSAPAPVQQDNGIGWCSLM